VRAFILSARGAEPVLTDVPVPEAGPGQVLVRVHAASLNASDYKMAFGMFPPLPGEVYPVTLGRDFAGVVEAAGAGVTGFVAGQQVCGFYPVRPHRHGSFADYVVLPADEGIVPVPGGLTMAEAGALGVAGTTALDAVDAVAPDKGDVVLILGATGGVGSYAVQLAVAAGATVLATGWAPDADYLHDLGVAEVLDRDADLASVLADPVDGLIDLVNPEPRCIDLLSLVRPGGRAGIVLSRIGPTEFANGVSARGVHGSAEIAVLGRLMRHAADGTIRVPLTSTVPLDEIGEGLRGFRDQHTVGKVGVTVG
jgi:NADPH:quinone reductase